jgi:regulator of PEP synthase PpsR (kinase-PPPase family)
VLLISDATGLVVHATVYQAFKRRIRAACRARELSWAHELCEAHGWRVFSVTGLAVEETAARIKHLLALR